jgi:hypothetical protein
MMYMRIVRAQPAEGQADELARRWAAFWPEKLRAQSGFQHAHFGIDRATGTTSGVTIFADQPDDALFAQLLAEFREALGASGPSQPPEVAVYEIAAEA